MELDNAEVLKNLKERRIELQTQYEQIKDMFLKVCGAIEVLEQIETSKGNIIEDVNPEVVEEQTEEKPTEGEQ